MKKIKGFRPVILVFLSLLCLSSMALPAVYAFWCNAHLVNMDIPRPIEEEQLSEEAQEIPVLYALYRKRYLSGIEMNGTWMMTDTTKQANILSQKIDELKNAKVLPEEAVQKADDILAQPSAMAYSQQQDGFIGGTCENYLSEQLSSKSVRLQWHEKTGLVTACSISFPSGQADTRAFLDAYRTYLGVNILTDWQTANTSESGTVCWSPTGQIYLYYTIHGEILSFGAVSLSTEEFSASFSELF